jgi:hypothetical protein
MFTFGSLIIAYVLLLICYPSLCAAAEGKLDTPKLLFVPLQKESLTLRSCANMTIPEALQD